MDLEASFGQWLKRRRKFLDLTREELARRVGCSAATIRKIEDGERRPSRQIADLLAAALEIPSEQRDLFIQCVRSERATLHMPPAESPPFPIDERPTADCPLSLAWPAG